ncbi:MAG: DUF4838 domain-containing protein [Verrucomicrobiales bacterium]|nr:DUF4838 domain-containing protein [Verrucomicrobiales bacterium]
MKTSAMKLAILFALIVPTACPAEVLLAERGSAKTIIVVDPAATATESFAARELASHLWQITGAEFVVHTNSKAPHRAILVGAGSAARNVFSEVPFDSFGPEELVIKTKGNRLLLAGGRPRGTLYAMSRFLQDQCGVRWWTPWASQIPKQATLRLSELNVRAKPAFEYRESFWYPAFDADWSWRNGCNGHSSRLTSEKGGLISYKGFVHTFYPLVPPEKHFAEHPEWFSLIKGKRATERAQLCLSNPNLRDFMVERVKQWLRESPDAGIISVSQNDWHGACECADCQALDEAEGTHAATLLAFVNYIAEKIEPEFPQVAVDTLAYQYTRKPPKTLKPRPNVIVRLCSIECNFREPLDHPSNAAFAEDIRGWSKLCQRLYIWDYTTDFAHYVQPHPNWFTIDANLRFFHVNGVRGVFEQGAYQSHGSEMAELRAWVLAQLLWNPHQNGRALIREFLEGYYGPEAAPHLRRYLDLMHEASKGHNLTCYSGTDAPFLRFKPLAAAEQLWQQAEAAAATTPEFLERVRLGHLALRYVWLSRWEKLRKECTTDSGAAWPLPDSRKQVADDWMAVANGVPGKPWTKVTLLSEGGLTPGKWVMRFEDTPAKP